MAAGVWGTNPIPRKALVPVVPFLVIRSFREVGWAEYLPATDRAHTTCVCTGYQRAATHGFTFVKWLRGEAIKRGIKCHNTRKLYHIQISVSPKKVLLGRNAMHLSKLACGCFHSTTAEWGRQDRCRVACKA